MLRAMTFDWKDGWLITGGFAVQTLLLLFLRNQDIELGRAATQAIAVSFVVAPLGARRKFFGSPELGRRRDGLLPRLGSIVGLLAMFFGLGVGAIAVNRISLPSESRPDHLAGELALVEQSIALEDTIGRVEPAGTTREASEKERARERAHAEKEARVRATELDEEWDAARADERAKTWTIAGVALALLIAGSLLLALRYERRAVE